MAGTAVAKETFDRPFGDLLADSVLLLRNAERETEDEYFYGALSRASLVASLFLLEAVANTCIESLALASAAFGEIDRLPVLAKYDLYIRTKFRRRRLDRGARAVQALRELKSLRDAYAHPKPQKVVWEEMSDDGLEAWPQRTAVLKVPTNPHDWHSEDAIIVMRSVHGFLCHFFREQCRLRPKHVAGLLFSEDDIPVAERGTTQCFDRSIRADLKRWCVDVSYCRLYWLSW